MRKFLFILFFVNSCVIMSDGRNAPVETFPEVSEQNRRSIYLSFENVGRMDLPVETVKKQFEKSGLFSKVITAPEIEKTDYTIDIVHIQGEDDCSFLKPLISAFTWLVIPNVCEFSPDRYNIEMTNNHNNKHFQVIKEHTGTMALGVVFIFMMPFYASDAMDTLDIKNTYDNMALRVYKMIQSDNG